MLGAFLFCIVLTGLGACTESNDNPVSPGDYGGEVILIMISIMWRSSNLAS